MTTPGWFAPLNPPLQDWRGRRVWLVGASSGIGHATAVELHRRGATVYLSARNADALHHFAALHPGAIALPLDITDGAQVRTAAASALVGGPLDLVVCCAGHYRELSATAFDLDELYRHQDVNYLGALRVLHAVIPGMLARGQGHLCLVGSVAGYRGLPRSVAYGPTKAALKNLAEALYLELRAHGLGVSLVSPGFVDTPLTRPNSFRMPALIGADEAARQMVQGWGAGRFEIHFPRRFTWPMKLLTALPFRLYQALVRKGTGL